MTGQKCFVNRLHYISAGGILSLQSEGNGFEVWVWRMHSFLAVTVNSLSSMQKNCQILAKNEFVQFSSTQKYKKIHFPLLYNQTDCENCFKSNTNKGLFYDKTPVSLQLKAAIGLVY